MVDREDIDVFGGANGGVVDIMGLFSHGGERSSPVAVAGSAAM